MFLGQYELNFSAPGRLVLPKKFRENLKGEGEIVLSRGLDGGIWGFAKSDWVKESEKQLSLPLTSKEARDLRRYLFSAAQETNLDDQGRFVIPKPLLDYAKIKNEAILIGAGDHFEIWNSRRWQRKLSQIISERGE